MDKLLTQQIRRHLTGLQEIPAEWKSFLEAVNLTYQDTEEDYDLQERAMDLTSNELLHKNANLLQEISERRRIEQDLVKAKNTAQKANVAKSDFLSRISHEFRTPMHAVLGFAQLLEIDREEPLSLSQLERTQQIIQAGKHLLALINEVLDLARIESGHLKLAITSINLHELNEEAVTLIKPLAQEHGIHVINNISKQPETYVQADPVRLKEVLLNLISNAVKYNREKGFVTVGLEKISDEKVTISITDTGPGISDDKQNDLFEPFNRLNANQELADGTGIGLSITKKLIELMKGSISVESKVGEGACFSIELPVGRKISAEEKTLDFAVPPPHSKCSRPLIEKPALCGRQSRECVIDGENTFTFSFY